MNKDNFKQRKARVRAKVFGTKDRPRLSVFRSNKGLYAQIIDDEKGETLVSAKGEKGLQAAAVTGEALAAKALKKKIKKVVFDKSGYKYHGRIKALADAARKGGLEF